jgi:hypothetical protein
MWPPHPILVWRIPHVVKTCIHEGRNFCFNCKKEKSVTFVLLDYNIYQWQLRRKIKSSLGTISINLSVVNLKSGVKYVQIFVILISN